MTHHPEKMIILGRLASAHGVSGMIKIQSFTDPDTNILDYNPWFLSTKNGYEAVEVLETRIQGPYLVAKLKGLEDRETAKNWTGRNIAVPRSALPSCDEDEYYWSDLEGLTVKNTDGTSLGKVAYLIDTGSKDVLVIEGNTTVQIPFIINETVIRVDLEAGEILVDWDINA